MKILIADDEPLARMRLRALVKEIGLCELLEAEASNGKEVLEMVRAYLPDVILLDIGMPGMNGMEAARQLGDFINPPVLIFTTAYDEYALEAFERQAVDYLLKPIRKERLQQALERALALYKEPRVAKPDLSESPTFSGVARTHISATVHGELKLIPVEKIYYLRADQKYVTLRWSGGEVLLDEALKNLEPEFSGQFLRIHRNALVALVHIGGMKKNREGQYFITFKDIDDSLEISRRHLQAVKQTIRDMWGKRKETD